MVWGSTHNILSASNDNVLQTIFDEQEAFIVDVANVPTLQPAIFSDCLGCITMSGTRLASERCTFSVASGSLQYSEEHVRAC